MLFTLMKFTHLFGILLFAAGLFPVLVQDILSRRTATLDCYKSTLRNMSIAYSFLALPGALLLISSGGWLIANYYGPIGLLEKPWLAGMVGLFSVWLFVTHVRVRFDLHRFRRMVDQGQTVKELEKLRDNGLSVVSLSLDLPILILILALGTFRPDSWVVLLAGIGFAVECALILTIILQTLSISIEN